MTATSTGIAYRTPYEKMTAEWAESKFHQFGLTDIHEQEFPLQPAMVPARLERICVWRRKTLALKTLTPALGAPSTPDGGLEAEAVWVGLGTAARFFARDVHGKVVVVQSMLQPGNVGHSAAWREPSNARRTAGPLRSFASRIRREPFRVAVDGRRPSKSNLYHSGFLDGLGGREDVA